MFINIFKRLSMSVFITEILITGKCFIRVWWWQYHLDMLQIFINSPSQNKMTLIFSSIFLKILFFRGKCKITLKDIHIPLEIEQRKFYGKNPKTKGELGSVKSLHYLFNQELDQFYLFQACMWKPLVIYPYSCLVLGLLTRL